MGTQQDNKMRLVLLLPVLVLVAVAAADNKGPAVYDNERLLFGSYKTTTYTVVSASTVYYSCLSGTYSALICKGRKRKSVRGMKDLSTPVEDMMLDSSGDAGSDNVKQLDNNNTNNNDQKFGFTVWTTSKTTTSITVMYTNTASTLRISYYCAAGGISFPVNPC